MSRFKPFWFAALPLVAVSLLASGYANAEVSSATPAVQTFMNGAATDPNMPTKPITPGEITMQDVLKAHPPQKKLPVQSLTPPAVPTAAAPLLKPPAKGSSESLMMMQGLKTVLQQSGASTTPLLKAPIMPGNEAVAAQRAKAAAAAPATATGAPISVSGVQYQPGQAPKDLASAALIAAGAVPSAAQGNEPMAAATVPPAPGATPESSTASADCAPKSSSWTKTCSEAGYPDNFIGGIQGETHTTCPGGTLQDVWITNTCAAPVEEASKAPLSAPETPSAGETTVLPNAATPNNNDATCGPANGMAVDTMPGTDLCNSGEPTSVTGQGPWRWSCKGQNGGMTVSCAAPVLPKPPAAVAKAAQEKANISTVVEDGACGSSDGVGVTHAPTGNLCNKGSPSRVNGSGPWTWACSGSNGGQATACTAPKITDGTCGSASNAAADEMPTSNLCDAGFASAVTGSGPWNWTCSGLYGGQAATCSAAPKQDAVCGTASLNGHQKTPKEGLCSVGAASSVSGQGPWNWTCSGANGGSAVSCEAPISVSGACGTANGTGVSEAPSEELCAKGTPTRVTGTGPWSWNCSGENGGDTESCTAPRISTPAAPSVAPVAAAASKKHGKTKPSEAAATETASTVSSTNMCGSAAELAAIEAPEKDLCKSGSASAVAGDGPWSWTCTDIHGSSSCSTLSPESGASETAEAKPDISLKTEHAAPPAPVVAACGSASSQGSTKAPDSDLCAVGKASKVRGTGPWMWTCAKDKTKATCQAAKTVDGICGTTNGTSQKQAPSSGLCNAGTATEIQGTGPWLWSCVGTGGGSSSSCSAAAQSQTRVDGSCGVATNEPSTSTPSANLCDSGVASTVYGEGPWTWTCSGLNGGIASSCSAQRNIPPAPPPPGPPVNGLCGQANGVAMLAQPMDDLCSTGNATGVSGNGPWNWNCIGENGGMTVSCTSPLQPPAPITGACGNANGVPTLTTPRSALCSAGISSAVSGQGPWTWSCSGTNGGGAVGCVAPLAGTGGGSTGSLPSMTTTPAAGEMNAPKAAPQVAVGVAHLTTPSLPSGTLPPLQTGTLPSLTPSKAFDRPPEPSAMPPIPESAQDMQAPGEAPQLPSGAQPLQPPPVRDTIKPSPALKPTGFDDKGNLIPGNHYVLEDDVSTIPFEHGSENIDASKTAILDKLAAVMQSHPGIRITLTAYADNSDTSAREARRLSLSRALTVRDYMTAKGISSSRIDVRALGANVSSGDADRVDVKAN